VVSQEKARKVSLSLVILLTIVRYVLLALFVTVLPRKPCNYAMEVLGYHCGLLGRVTWLITPAAIVWIF